MVDADQKTEQWLFADTVVRLESVRFPPEVSDFTLGLLCGSETTTTIRCQSLNVALACSPAKEEVAGERRPAAAPGAGLGA